MSGSVWHIFTFGAIGFSLIVTTYRTLAIRRLPVHLRWELAPLPHERGKSRYGGSYLEEYEWWNKPRSKSRITPTLYMAQEIFLLRGVWKHNRALWPFTFSLHMGLYLIAGMLFWQVVTALLVIAQSPSYILDFSLGLASVFAGVGYLLGSLGAVGLILKRVFDSNLSAFTTRSRYLNLLLLGAVFISGSYAWLNSRDFASGMNLFMKGLITLDAGATAAFPLSLHLVIALLFILYLPLTDMMHFVAKYFTYHEIRWNDEPRNEKMEKELSILLAQPVTWAAPHVKADGRRNWVDIAATEMSDDKEA